jgi:hypothetical protein
MSQILLLLNLHQSLPWKHHLRQTLDGHQWYKSYILSYLSGKQPKFIQNLEKMRVFRVCIFQFHCHYPDN